ncbi:MAG: RC-LH1 core complex protein PufX [Pseudomonadota bacterium]
MSSSNNGPFDGGDFSRSSIYWSVFGQMIWGSFAAATLLIGTGALLYGIYLVGLLLPPESKEADDPTPDSFSQLVAPEDARIV